MARPQDDGWSTGTHPLGPLTLNGEGLQALERQTQETYLADSRPWVIGYSGGKDSTVVVQHTWHALSALPREKLTKPVYVISSDTLVESPVIVEQIRTTLQRIEDGGGQHRAAIQDRHRSARHARHVLGEPHW